MAAGIMAVMHHHQTLMMDVVTWDVTYPVACMVPRKRLDLVLGSHHSMRALPSSTIGGPISESRTVLFHASLQYGIRILYHVLAMLRPHPGEDEDIKKMLVTFQGWSSTTSIAEPVCFPTLFCPMKVITNETKMAKYFQTLAVIFFP